MRSYEFSPRSQREGKHRYPTKKEARRWRKRTETAFGTGKMVEYRCSWCGWFHFGHQPPAEVIQAQET